LKRREHTLTTRGDELDSSGTIPPPMLLRYLEQLRWLLVFEFESDASPFTELLGDGRSIVVRAQQLAIVERVSFGVTLRLSTWIGRVGRTSLDFRHEISRADDGRLIARAAVTMVCLSADGKPRGVPGHIKDLVEADDRLLVAPPPPRPPGSGWSTDLVVRLSDTDILHHVNHASYLCYFEDARWTAARAGGYGGAGEAAKLPCARVALEYRQQALAGETLRVCSWPLPADPPAFGFEAVRRRDGRLLASARIEVDPAKQL